MHDHVDDHRVENPGVSAADAVSPNISGGASIAEWPTAAVPQKGPCPVPPGDLAAVGAAAEYSVRDCSAALKTFLALCPPGQELSGPWAWLPVADDCHRPPADPTAIVETLRHEFPDRMLCAVHLIEGPNEGPTLHRSLCPHGGGVVVPVREPVEGIITDLLTPRGLLSSEDTPQFSVPILPAQPESLADMDFVFGTVNPQELVLLHTLGLPAVLLRGMRSTSLAALKTFGSFEFTSVPGCRPLGGGSSTTSTAAAPSNFSMSPSLVVMGFSFLALPWSIPSRVRALLRYVRRVRDGLDLDLGDRVLVSAPSREHLEQLQQRLRRRDVGLIREWFMDNALRSLVNWGEFHAWSFPEEVFRSYDTVRRDIVTLLQEQPVWSSSTLQHLQRLHGELIAAVDRELVERLYDRAAQVGNIVQGLPARLLASAVRGWLITAPYAYVAQVPSRLRLGIDLGGLSVSEFHAAMTDKVLKLLTRPQIQRLLLS